MIKHKKELGNYHEGFEKLAKELGDLRYDSLSQFLEYLSVKLKQDSFSDGQRNRRKLSNELLQASKEINDASIHIRNAWDICEPYMDSYEK